MAKSAVERRSVLPLARKLHGSISDWGWMKDGDDDQTTQEELAKAKFKHVKLLLKLTGLYYDKEPTGRYEKAFRLAKEIFLISIIGYVAVSKLFELLFAKSYSEKTLPQVLFIDWTWQSLFSMIFLVYWQRRNYLNQLFIEVSWPNISPKYSNTRSAIRYVLIFCILVIFFILICPVGALILVYLGRFDELRFDHSDFNLFGSLWLLVGINCYTNITFHIVLCFYVIVSITVCHELEKFNLELKELGHNMEIGDEEFEDKFIKMYITHSKLGSMVRSVDNFFEVYTFVLIGLNIPLTVFTILNTFVSFKSPLDTLFSAPALVFSILELIALSLVPAKLYETIRCVEGIIYGSTRVWNPYNERIYNVANAFISHVKQSNLGISIWGFALLTKPTILTTISVTLTYLALLIELKSNAHSIRLSGNNGTTFY